MLEWLNIHLEKLQNLNSSYLIPYTEINSKWTIDSWSLILCVSLTGLPRYLVNQYPACFSEDVLDMINIKISKLSKADSSNQLKARIQQISYTPLSEKGFLLFPAFELRHWLCLALGLEWNISSSWVSSLPTHSEDPETCQLPCFQEPIPYNKSLSTCIFKCPYLYFNSNNSNMCGFLHTSKQLILTLSTQRQVPQVKSSVP